MITRYRTLKRLALAPGLYDAAALLDETLQEGSQTGVDLTLTADAADEAEAMQQAA